MWGGKRKGAGRKISSFKGAKNNRNIRQYFSGPQLSQEPQEPQLQADGIQEDNAAEGTPKETFVFYETSRKSSLPVTSIRFDEDDCPLDEAEVEVDEDESDENAFIPPDVTEYLDKVINNVREACANDSLKTLLNGSYWIRPNSARLGREFLRKNQDFFAT